MKIPLKRIQWVEFHEHPISHPKKVKVELFEIYSQGFKQSKDQQNYFNHPLYCKNATKRAIENFIVMHYRKSVGRKFNLLQFEQF